MTREAPIETDIRLTCVDTQKSIGINYQPQRAVNAAELFKGAFGPNACPEAKVAFPTRFQGMVKKIFENAEQVIEIIEG